MFIPDIVIDPDWVELFSTRIVRPSGVSVSQWLEFWERAQQGAEW